MDTKAEINKRIYECIDALISDGIVPHHNAFFFSLKMFPQAGTTIKRGKRSFTIEQIYNMCHMYKINPNYIFGVSKDKFRI